MAFREMSMVDVREILRRWQLGQSARQIARDQIADRKTAQNYIKETIAIGINERSELTDEIVSAVMRAVQARAAPPPSDAWQALEGVRAKINEWLNGKDPLRLTRVHELLGREGIEVSYTTLRRFCSRELGWRERPPSVRVDDPPPGQEAQIDFGLAGYLLDGSVRRKLWMLLVTLSMSRYMFVWPTFVQTVEALCEGLDAAWRFFGGVPHRVVPDNMAAIVLRANSKQPILNQSFAEYAQSRGFIVDPARVRSPQDKPRVENQVPYARERWFAGEQFSGDLVEVRAHAEHWCREIAGARVHGTTRRVPREVFELEEKMHLLPAPTSAFDVPVWTKAKVHPDHHVQVAKSLYSLPTRFIGREIDVRYDRACVRMYIRGELVKVHGRVAAGKRSTDPNDYPQEKVGYAMRSVDRLIADSTTHGESVGEYAKRLLGGPLPWTRMRQAYALVRLCDRFGDQRVDALCARSLSFDVIDVGRIERMLKTAQRIEDSGESAGKVARLPSPRFARQSSAFATRQKASDEGGAK
jgi:transposase